MTLRVPAAFCKTCKTEVVFRKSEIIYRLPSFPRYAYTVAFGQASSYRVNSRSQVVLLACCTFPTAKKFSSVSILASVSRTIRKLTFCRYYATEENKVKESKSDAKKSLVEARENPYAGLTAGQKVKEVGKDATYTVVIVAGIAVTVLMFYMIGRELFSAESPSGLYGAALKACQDNIQVAAALGEPIKGYGETTRRGRRRYISHTEFEVNGVPHMRLRFYIEGPYGKATVHAEMRKGENNKYEYRYLIVETEAYPHRTFILEDNR